MIQGIHLGKITSLEEQIEDLGLFYNGKIPLSQIQRMADSYLFLRNNGFLSRDCAESIRKKIEEILSDGLCSKNFEEE